MTDLACMWSALCCHERVSKPLSRACSAEVLLAHVCITRTVACIMREETGRSLMISSCYVQGARVTQSGLSTGRPEDGTHSAATAAAPPASAAGEVDSPIRPDPSFSLPRLPAAQATPAHVGSAHARTATSGAGGPNAGITAGLPAVRPVQGPMFVSEPQFGQTATAGGPGCGPASPVIVPTGKRSKPAQATAERRPPYAAQHPALAQKPLPVTLGPAKSSMSACCPCLESSHRARTYQCGPSVDADCPVRQVSSPLQPPSQGSGSFSPARVRQSPAKFRQSPGMAGDGDTTLSTAAAAAVPIGPMPVPTRAKRTQNRHVSGHMNYVLYARWTCYRCAAPRRVRENGCGCAGYQRVAWPRYSMGNQHRQMARVQKPAGVPRLTRM